MGTESPINMEKNLSPVIEKETNKIGGLTCDQWILIDKKLQDAPHSREDKENFTFREIIIENINTSASTVDQLYYLHNQDKVSPNYNINIVLKAMEKASNINDWCLIGGIISETSEYNDSHYNYDFKKNPEVKQLSARAYEEISKQINDRKIWFDLFSKCESDRKYSEPSQIKRLSDKEKNEERFKNFNYYNENLKNLLTEKMEVFNHSTSEWLEVAGRLSQWHQSYFNDREKIMKYSVDNAVKSASNFDDWSKIYKDGSYAVDTKTKSSAWEKILQMDGSFDQWLKVFYSTEPKEEKRDFTLKKSMETASNQQQWERLYYVLDMKNVYGYTANADQLQDRVLSEIGKFTDPSEWLKKYKEKRTNFYNE